MLHGKIKACIKQLFLVNTYFHNLPFKVRKKEYSMFEDSAMKREGREA
jgi:hypothetical protein